MRICLLHVCAYNSHMDINIQANEQEPTLAVKTKKKNQTTSPSTSAQLCGTWK